MDFLSEDLMKAVYHPNRLDYYLINFDYIILNNHEKIMTYPPQKVLYKGHAVGI